MKSLKDTYLLQCMMEKAEKSSFACLMLSNGFEDPHGRWQWMLGFDVENSTADLANIDLNAEVPWMGFVSYDYKNSIEPLLVSEQPTLGCWPDVKFVQPLFWVALDRNDVLHGNAVGLEWYKNVVDAYENLPANETPSAATNLSEGLNWQAMTNRADYLSQIEIIKSHIVAGDFYEINHCIAFTADAVIDPYATFLALNTKSAAPFACFVKDADQFLLCASPERFIALKNGNLISQPIKGTRKRAKVSADVAPELRNTQQKTLDDRLAKELKSSPKDRAENIMIVDLVRNDLSRVCLPGTVLVKELCEVYSYSHVHQMVSTVFGTPRSEIGVEAMFAAMFPMGSMTGAPKIAVMKHTESLENFSRSIYSGTVGYVWRGNIDFNVVIRSLIYDAKASQIHYAVGGAITIDSVAAEEYQECADKAATVLSIFKAN